MEAQKKFGIIGFPLKHSFSPKYFNEKFAKQSIRAQYDFYEIDDIKKFNDLKNSGVSGFNVTIPYKEQIIPYLDELSYEAQAIRAVNCIQYKDKKWIGHNTDCFGFEQSLVNFYKENKPDNALVLGSGGASKAVGFALQKLGINFRIVSRKSHYLNYQDLEDKHFEGRILIVNTTPLGTWPDIYTKPPIPYHKIIDTHFLYDLVYNPEKTLFLYAGEKNGASIKNGYEMLILQAEKSWEIWNS